MPICTIAEKNYTPKESTHGRTGEASAGAFLQCASVSMGAISMSARHKKIVVLGGGTGTSAVLRALKAYPVHLTAIPSMADDGGSTGILRRELRVLPPGDVRQCIIALADNEDSARALFGYRFDKGVFRGHNMGNLILAALEQECGSFEKAVGQCSDLLSLRGAIHPATYTSVTLSARLKNETVRGQSAIHTRRLDTLEKLFLEPHPKANPQAITAINEADTIIFAPGDWFSSVMPNFLIPALRAAVKKSHAKKIHICNLATKRGHTDGWNVHTFRTKLEEAIGGTVDYTIYNGYLPRGKGAQRYEDPEHLLVEIDEYSKKCYIRAKLLRLSLAPRDRSDLLTRNNLRHDEKVLGAAIMNVVEHRYDYLHRD